jgi:hypothetical protein
MRYLVGLVLLLVLGVAGCGGDRPTEPDTMKKNPFKEGRMKNMKPK